MDAKNLKEASPSNNALEVWKGLIRPQYRIAKSWLDKGTGISDPYAQFFFYFAGFNAIYFLWGKIDKKPDQPETAHIENLLKKFDDAKAKKILDEVKTSIDYFCKRNPIRQMKTRTNTDLIGDNSKGDKWQRVLKDEKLSASERLVALGYILYLVRSNLVHGSKEKSESGDDSEIIEYSLKPLKAFLKEAIAWTYDQYPYI